MILTALPPPYTYGDTTTEFPPPVVVEFGVAIIVGVIVYVFESVTLIISVVTFKLAAVTYPGKTAVAPDITIFVPAVKLCDECVTVIVSDPFVTENGLFPSEALVSGVASIVGEII